MTQQEVDAYNAPLIFEANELFSAVSDSSSLLNQGKVDDAYFLLSSVARKYGSRGLSVVRQHLVEVLIIQRRADEALTLLAPQYVAKPDEQDFLALAAALALSGRTQPGQREYTDGYLRSMTSGLFDDAARLRVRDPLESALLALAFSRDCLRPRSGAALGFFRMVVEKDPTCPFALQSLADRVPDPLVAEQMLRTAWEETPANSAYRRYLGSTLAAVSARNAFRSRSGLGKKVP